MGKTKSHSYDEAFHLKQNAGLMVNNLPELITEVVKMLEEIKNNYKDGSGDF